MKRFALALLLLLLVLPAVSLPASASSDLDRIRSYDVTVIPNRDGSLSMTATFVWEVLDSTSEGPLTWVRVGIPNIHAAEITALTDNIDRVERDGEYIEVYFKDEYKAGDVVTFSFGWHQTYMYLLGDDGMVNFDYTPGWFEGSVIDCQTIHWRRDPSAVYEMSANDAANYQDLSDGEWLILSAENVAHGGKLHLSVTYPSDAFDGLTEENSRTHAQHMEPGVVIGLALVAAAAVLIVAALFWHSYRTQKDPDYWTGGYTDGPVYDNPSHVWLFTVRHHTRVPHGGFAPPPGRAGDGANVSGGKRIERSSSGSGGMHGGGCACACACACAGGGRAGCSKKDVFGAAARADRVRHAAEEEIPQFRRNAVTHRHDAQEDVPRED